MSGSIRIWLYNRKLQQSTQEGRRETAFFVVYVSVQTGPRARR
jgi:hypothetical protein